MRSKHTGVYTVLVGHSGIPATINYIRNADYDFSMNTQVKIILMYWGVHSIGWAVQQLYIIIIRNADYNYSMNT